jgi:tetratricopeptide (TPR) repeat protein
VESGLRLLHPVIRSNHLLDNPAVPAEICEYAVLLSRNGSVPEALALLNSVDVMVAPEAMLYKGFCHVLNWNYQQAAVEFENFLKSQPDIYTKLIARVNLIAAFVANSQLEAAENLLAETLSMAQEQQALRLIGNCFELRAQIAFFRRDFSKARMDLERSLEVFAQSGSYDQLLIQKWQASMEALETGTLEPLSRFSEEATKRKHWESVRDTDFYRLKIRFDQRAFDHLIFGTPSRFYCQRVQKELSQNPSDFYLFGSETGLVFDLKTGQLSGSDEISGTKIHQTFSALLRDFYAPSNVGQLFAEIYPDDYFDVESSPDRIRQILRRARRWMEANAIPAEISENNGGYRLVLKGEFGIRIPSERVAVDIMSTQWQMLIAAFPSQDQFSAEEACRKLAMSRTSFHRLSVWAIENHLLVKTGINKKTVYLIVSKKMNKGA